MRAANGKLHAEEERAFTFGAGIDKLLGVVEPGRTL
jgi:hypothetical protein